MSMATKLGSQTHHLFDSVYNRSILFRLSYKGVVCGLAACEIRVGDASLATL